MIEGINIAGFLTAESGLGTACRNLVHAVQSAGIPHTLLPVTCTPSRQDDSTFAAQTSFVAPHPVSLLHVNPDCIAAAKKELPIEFFRGKYRIGYWTWEATELPHSWKKAMQGFDALWVPSTYVKRMLDPFAAIPVHVVPHAIATPGARTRSRRDFGFPSGMLFLIMVDYLSIMERKNPLGAITAFQQAFPATDNVHLVIKCLNAATAPDKHASLLAAADDPRIHIMDRYLSAAETTELLQMADVFLSLHRSEGFGLSIAEAMAAGTPVIATGYGGNTDFQNEGLVGFVLRELRSGIGPYPKGSVWAEPDIAHAAVLMRSAVNDPNMWLKRAESARSEICADLSPERIGSSISRAIASVSA